MYKDIIAFIRTLYAEEGFIPLHAPVFMGNEKEYLLDTIDSTFVSSVGAYVDTFEKKIAESVGSRYAVATVNGTAALHIALKLVGVDQDHEVITQPLTFVATANAISYEKAHPHFVDVDKDTLGLSPQALKKRLEEIAVMKDGRCYNKVTQRPISACVPMHTFGFPCRINEIVELCDEYNIAVVEDAAESLGSLYNSQSTGTFGKVGTLSFNGNKIITAGGGGAIITDNEQLAKHAKHITTTAKVPHPWEYRHDQIAYNYRMPNLNAALLVAQLENLESYLYNKKLTALQYAEFFKQFDSIQCIESIEGAEPNYWLNTIRFEGEDQKNNFLEETNAAGVMTRPIWTLMTKLPMYENAQQGELTNAIALEKTIANIPSSVRI